MRSIRLKLIFWICVLFIFMGGLIYLPLSIILPRKIIGQILKRDTEMAVFLSNQAENLLLLNDRLALSVFLHDSLERIEDAQYLFVQDSEGDIVSHTFIKGFPKGLLSFRSSPPDLPKVKEFLNRGQRLYDIAIPISGGELGALHLGVSLESGRSDLAEMAKINYYIAIVILIGLGIGILVFLIIGFLFSSQIIKLKNVASQIGRGDLETKIEINSKDELGALALTFNEMAQNLKEKIEEIKRLNTIEERNKIALDLHDGCSQDLANIIKRIELCEKLLNRNPSQAIEELVALRKTTKELLDRTRQVIFDLKSPQESGYNLLNNLTDYINNYRRKGRIQVDLIIPDSIISLPPAKAKSIMYIITEALTNVRKHSQAGKVELSLMTGHNGSLTIDIKDDGMGFDIDRVQAGLSNGRQLGLISMRQRASSLGGRFTIKSSPQEGTKISVEVPISKGV